jgi:hypothetical protein
MKNLKASKNKIIRETPFVKNIRYLLFMGVSHYRITSRLNWHEISDIMEKNGYKYSTQGLAAIANNWAATRLDYFYPLYEVLGIDYPTPANLVKWEQEIKELQQERRERIDRQKAKAASRKLSNNSI